MDYIENRTTNCYELSATDDQNVVDWTAIQNFTGDVIDFGSTPLAPTVVYRQLNDTHYQWCGTFLHFAEYFAKFTKTRSV